MERHQLHVSVLTPHDVRRRARDPLAILVSGSETYRSPLGENWESGTRATTDPNWVGHSIRLSSRSAGVLVFGLQVPDDLGGLRRARRTNRPECPTDPVVSVRFGDGPLDISNRPDRMIICESVGAETRLWDRQGKLSRLIRAIGDSAYMTRKRSLIQSQPRPYRDVESRATSLTERLAAMNGRDTWTAGRQSGSVRRVGRAASRGPKQRP